MSQEHTDAEIGEKDPGSMPTAEEEAAAERAEGDQPDIKVMRTDSQAFADYVEALGVVNDGYIRDICNLKPPRKVEGKIEI